MSEKQPLVEQFEVNPREMGGWYVVRLRGERNKDNAFTWLDFEIFDVPAADKDYKPSYYANEQFEMYGGGPQTSGITEDLDAAVPSITGFVKGDGCTQFRILDEPVHFDSDEDLQAWAKAIKETRDRALQVMADSGGTW